MINEISLPLKSLGRNGDLLRTCHPRHYLARSEQPCEAILIVTGGVLVREQSMPDGRRQILGVNVPGDVCGLTALCDGHVDHDMMALSPVTYRPVPRHVLSSMVKESAELSRAVWREMSREMAISAAWIANIGQRPAYQRTAFFFCELDARLRGANLAKETPLEWPGNQGDLGAALGLSMVHVNRTLRRLELDQLISGGRGTRFHDIEKLRDVAGFDPAYLALGDERLGDMLLARLGGHSERQRDTAQELPARDGPLAHSLETARGSALVNQPQS